MSDVNNERPEGTPPPPLIPPPVRTSDPRAGAARSSEYAEQGQSADPADQTHDLTDAERSGEREYAEPVAAVAVDSDARPSSEQEAPAAVPVDAVRGDSARSDSDRAESPASDNADSQQVAAVPVEPDRFDERATTTDVRPTLPVAGAAAPAPAADARGAESSPSEVSGQGFQAQAAAVPTAPQPQRTFQPPPTEPKKKGNRGVGSLIALLSVILFAVLYALVAALIINSRAPQELGQIFTSFATSPVFYVPAILFVVGFLLVVLLANRANWWAYVLGSLLVGAVVYFGTIGVGLLTENVVTMTPAEATSRFADYAVDPFIIAAALIAREVSLWTGSAIASRGRRIKARNVSAREEYERASAAHREQYERGFASTPS